MSIRFLLGVAVGAAGGYAVGRVMEARANGVPVGVALRNLGRSVAELRKDIEDAAQTARGAARRVRAAVPALQAVPEPQGEELNALEPVGLDAFN